MDMLDTELMLKSVVRHLQSALASAGWSDTDKCVIEGYLEPEMKPPVAAVSIGQDSKAYYELGGVLLVGAYTADVELLGQTVKQVRNLKDAVQKNLTGIPVIDFNTAMPGDEGYDEAAQTVAYANPMGAIKGTIFELQRTGRVSVTLSPDKPF